MKVCKVFLWFWKTYLKLWTTFSSGTPFMVRLHEQLKFFVNYKISTDLAWQGLKIYLSGHEVWIYSTIVLKKWVLRAQFPALVIFPFWLIHLNACNFKFFLNFLFSSLLLHYYLLTPLTSEGARCISKNWNFISLLLLFVLLTS